MPTDPFAATQTCVATIDFAIKRGTTIYSYLRRNYGYVKDMSKNYDKLLEAYKELCDEEEDVNKELEINEIEKEQTNACKHWLKKVEEMKKDVQGLEEKYKKSFSCLCGLCPFFRLVKLGGRIVKKTEKVRNLKAESNKIRSLMVQKAPAPHITNPTNKISEFPSLEENVKELQDCLIVENLKRICVLGPIGVGKSTTMNRLHQTMKGSKMFEIVFLIAVGRKRNERYIQQELLKRLQIKPKKFSDEQRKSIIHEQLKNRSYLLLLDEVFSKIDLEEIGINDEHKGKVVFASRYLDVCEQADEQIEVKRLSNMDAQNMFWEKVGVHLKDNPHIKREAELIIKFCSGNPYLIKLIGNYLASKARVPATNGTDPAIWRNTLHELRSPTGEPKRDLEEVYKSLKLEVDRLRPDEKSCFLYLAIFPAGHELHRDYIIECWRAEQFLKRFEKLGEARDGGNVILRYFVDNSLLEKEMKEERYKMFEFYQQVAFRFAKHNENNYIQDKEMVREIKWEDATRISMIGDSCLPTLPDEPNSERILTLLLQEISCLAKFPRSFFLHMSALQLLDLYKSKIETLPSSISSLKNLKAMFLKNCDQLIELRDEVGDLHGLEILDICHTGISHLPPVIGNLIALKCLRVSFKKIIWSQNHVNGSLSDMISSDVIARLHSLEELGIVVDPTDGRWDQNVESIVTEIAVLKELTTLCFYFPTMNCFETFVSTSILWKGNNAWKGERLGSFNIIVGHQQGNSPTEFDVSEWSAEKRLRFSAGEAFPDAILKILKQACSCELIGHRAANLSVFSADNLEGLEVCMIEDCPEMTSIIDGNLTTGAAFKRLNKLHIEGLPKLMHIWKGSMVPQSLMMLTNLTLKECHSLKVLFSEEMVLRLNLLQYIQIEGCQVMEEIIKDGSIVDSGAFPKLKILELINLPLLSKICNDATLTWNSLEVLKIESCTVIEEITKDEGIVDSGAFPKLKNFELVNLPKLSKVCKNVSLKWDSLETLKIDTCMELKSFPATFRWAEKLAWMVRGSLHGNCDFPKMSASDVASRHWNMSHTLTLGVSEVSHSAVCAAVELFCCIVYLE
ncbi:hypothetical protein Patl1_26724 [Pistacia atlantica]|uniref:Uncharacterized protein n=1 Tax=Pistacia atlantica TaxID=434234 RepID=A0ACC1B366_9ROSI|nr:hypothetical protein Patl1_26724 [Pistacia atlantica]